MSHTYTSTLIHCVFSTKERHKTMTPEIKERLWAYMGGIARENKIKALAMGGIDDHVHLLLSLPATMPVSKAIQLIKGGSSKWVHETFVNRKRFAWQEGYGAFSIGISQVDETISYIQSQPVHHGKRSFQDEYRQFLEKHGIEYDERYVWG
jgi:REP element-mobilizing transposase RayT